ncbi:hypothetical protein FB45DRAFT_806856 [Roridomyces roridus]|uniref:DUF202 domain-containing protein n=1 Tax=Roridomyces roridus TaxID=1738132 RepID=A0AAD7B0Z2_9AGAR|nr:hypothetical protein FB45DRAFT_806856 [Roridomyces roridus]
MSGGHRYHGHRAASFRASDLNELVEIRARQRTFHGAYSRTALSNLGYSLTILRLFDTRFHTIGLLFAILGAVLYVLAFLRATHSRHDFADEHKSEVDTVASLVPRPRVIQTKGQENKRVFGRPFLTAGWIVVGVACVVACVEVGLLVLVLKI